MNFTALNGFVAACQRYFDGSMMRGFDGGYSSFGSYGSWIGLIGHGIFSLFLLALGVALVVWLVRLAKRTGNSNAPSGFGPTVSSDTTSALKLLNERYVKGEVTEEEYLKIKKNLSE